MKKSVCLLLSMVLVFSLWACSGSDAGTADNTEKAPETTAATEPAPTEDPTVLQAGFARQDCIPDDPLVHIAGGTAADDPATDGLLDNLAVTCVALKKNGETYLIFTCDIVDIVEYKSEERVITEATGVPDTHIIFNATHTHSAPTLKPSDANLPGMTNYAAKFNMVCKDVAVEAIADLSPVSELSYGQIMTEDMVRVRHYLMNDGTTYGNGHGSTASGFKEHLYPADEECQVIRLTRPAGDKKDIVLFNLGAHATIVSGTHTSALSADFPFPARQYVEEQGDFLAAYFIAAAGDQIPGSKIPTEVKNKRDHFAYGEQLGEYVIRCLEENMTVSESTDISLYGEKYFIKRKGLPAYTEGEVLKRSDCTTIPTNTMMLGDIGLVFFPGEMFGSQGRQLKDDSPVFAFVITCSEDDKMYFPSPIAFREGFYESKTTLAAEGAGEAAAARYVEILTAMSQGKTPDPQALQD